MSRRRAWAITVGVRMPNRAFCCQRVLASGHFAVHSPMRFRWSGPAGVAISSAAGLNVDIRWPERSAHIGDRKTAVLLPVSRRPMRSAGASQNVIGAGINVHQRGSRKPARRPRRPCLTSNRQHDQPSGTADVSRIAAARNPVKMMPHQRAISRACRASDVHVGI